ncbi:MAG: hypothetical protein ACREBW_05965 [Candidatus Micrarchaeaceae archaeon]
MLRFMAVAVLIFASLSAHGAQALASPDKSFYSGQLVEHPEALSGLWETFDGRGGTIGIHLILDTTIPGDATSFKGVPQSWEDLQVRVFDRRGPEAQVDEENGFSDSSRGGGVRFESGRLTLHFGSIDLNLVKRPDDTWVGRLHRGQFDANVVLRRPTVAKPNPVVGTWLSAHGPASVCMHVAEVAPGEFIGWSDSLLSLGKVRMAPHIARPATAHQRYGELMKVVPEGNERFSFQMPAHPALCCSHTFVGHLQPRDRRIDGFWPSGPNQVPRKGSWRKMRGNSCIEGQDL